MGNGDKRGHGDKTLSRDLAEWRTGGQKSKLFFVLFFLNFWILLYLFFYTKLLLLIWCLQMAMTLGRE